MLARALDSMPPRYPTAHAEVHSTNPLVLIAAVRTALRQAGASRDDIRRFTREAFSAPPEGNLVEHCQSWVQLELPQPRRSEL